jgi:multimeric flavodoxin WrbA
MQVLAIMGSPRKKGNTYKITKKVEKEMKHLGNVEFEYLFLKDVNLQPCTGCFVCISKDGNLCPIKDDRTLIEEKIKNADGVILASPVYVMQISWLMKVLVDRMAHHCHRPRFFNQKAIAIATTGGIGLKETLNYLELVAGAWGLNFVDKLGLQTPPWPKSSKAYSSDEEKIKITAKIFYKALEKKDRRNPSLMEYVGFRIFKEMSNSLKEYLPADYHFYKNHENYYYDTDISFVKKIIASIMLKIIFFMMRDNFDKENKKMI